MPRVLLAIRHPRLRAVLREYVADTADFVMEEVAGLEEMWRRLAQEVWDVLTFDLHDAEASQVKLIAQIHRTYPTLPILVLSLVPAADPEHWARAGARGIVSKARLAEDLVEALHALSRGNCYF